MLLVGVVVARVYCPIVFVFCMLYGLRRLLLVVCGSLFDVRCVLFALCCLLCQLLLFVVRRVLYVGCCMFFVGVCFFVF